MSIMKNATEGISYPMQPYQQALWNTVSSGFKAGQMMIISAGRHSGKSYLNQLYGNNLCQEIMLTGQHNLKELGFFVDPHYPKTKAALNRLMPKYKFSRAKWYESKLYKNVDNALDWCEQHFGKEPNHPDAWSRWYFNVDRKFRFRDEKDYEWFLLRWE